VAIAEGKWQVAYRFLEDGLISPISETKTKAIALFSRHPEMKIAAAKTFEVESLQKTLNDHGVITGAAIERNRLRMYAVVAGNDELKIAAENYQKLVDQIADEESEVAARKIKEEEEAARKKAKDEEEAAMRTAKEEAAAAALNAEFEKAVGNAKFRCKDRLECEKAFSLTQIFIATNTDMKIQMANDTIIETYNPNKTASMGATAFKIPKEGTSAEIRLVASCRGEDNKFAEKACKLKSILLSTDFPRFLRNRLVN
jgi:D-alanyl-D-alanine carboxypeptidase